MSRVTDRLVGELTGSLAAGALFAAMLASPLCAAEASAWDGQTGAAVRLIAGTASDRTSMLRAGIEIRLDPGWKTYWRYPGDSGVPPRFDFAQSVNVNSVKLLWSAPHHVVD